VGGGYSGPDELPFWSTATSTARRLARNAAMPRSTSAKGYRHFATLIEIISYAFGDYHARKGYIISP